MLNPQRFTAIAFNEKWFGFLTTIPHLAKSREIKARQAKMVLAKLY